MIRIFVLLLASLSLQSCFSQNTNNKTTMDNKKNPAYSRTDNSKVVLKEDEWKNILSPEVYYISRQKGTERPYTSKFENFKEIGTYYCGACGNPLFKSDTKFDAGCGWPSFYEPISKSSIIYLPDNTLGMKRTEVECGRCKGHLGHVFDDGPPPTGLRYCINGVVLDFEKAQAAEKKYDDEKSKVKSLNPKG
jgi:peptide-methionine (R)-S-oxide reductase